MEKHVIRLSSSELNGLWGIYIQETMTVCMLKYFLHHIKDEEIQVILQKALEISQSNLEQIKIIFSKEKIPLPDGFTDEDIILSVKPLFYDTFALSFIYSMCRMGMINYAFITSNVARLDIVSFFTNAINKTAELFSESTTLMLSKGIYDRPPMIPYPKEVEYIEKPTYLANFVGIRRPLNAAELTEIFFNIERNYFSIIICMGLLQVVKDKEIKNHIKKGKEISEKQLNFLNDILKKEDLLGQVSVSMEVTDSTNSPFSDKLVMSLFHLLNSIDITLIGHALSLAMRVDLAGFYSKTIGEILIYAEKGFNILVDRKWLEQPPQSPNRQELEKS
jgi:hypothetical protein